MKELYELISGTVREESLLRGGKQHERKRVRFQEERVIEGRIVM